MTRKLYEILGVDAKASEAEIRRAFRVRALSVHPDKRPDDAAAAENFHQLRNAYDVLSNPERRSRYDETGDENEDVESALSYFRAEFPKVTQTAIDSFAKTYKNSPEEDEDLRQFYQQRDGDVSLLLECIPLSTPDDIPRLLARLKELIKAGELSETPQFKPSITKLKVNGRKYNRKYSREAASADEALADLASAIRSRRVTANVAFLADLEDRFLPKKSRVEK